MAERTRSTHSATKSCDMTRASVTSSVRASGKHDSKQRPPGAHPKEWNEAGNEGDLQNMQVHN